MDADPRSPKAIKKKIKMNFLQIHIGISSSISTSYNFANIHLARFEPWWGIHVHAFLHVIHMRLISWDTSYNVEYVRLYFMTRSFYYF